MINKIIEYFNSIQWNLTNPHRPWAEKIDLTIGGEPRVTKVVYPDGREESRERPQGGDSVGVDEEYNAFWDRVWRLNQQMPVPKSQRSDVN